MAQEHYLVINGNVIPLTDAAFIATYERVEADRRAVPYHEIAEAPDDPRFGVVNIDELLSTEYDTPTVSGLAAANGVNVDALVRKYAEASERMYENRTAGDNSHLGLIASLILELDGVIKS